VHWERLTSACMLSAQLFTPMNCLARFRRLPLSPKHFYWQINT
jgi:hypothetical protein